MSFLEDVFLQDEADEAQELERVIEGDEYDERLRPLTPNSNEDSEKEDEAEEDKRRVEPTKAKEKKVVRNPRLVLNPARLTGPRGIQIIPEHFKDFRFKGKGHEKDDLDLVLKRLEHWAYRLFPKFQFEDCLKKIETLGKKKPVMVHLHKIRTDQFMSEETVIQRDSSDDEDIPMPPQEEDEFDKLLQQQIELARTTPAPGSVKKDFETPKPDRSLLMPKATSSPSISDEQRERMVRNRQLAEERRLAKLKQNVYTFNSDKTNRDSRIHTPNISTVKKNVIAKKNKSNVIDSSDDECDITTVNQFITVDVHNCANNNEINGTSVINGYDNEIAVLEDCIVKENEENPESQSTSEDIAISLNDKEFVEANNSIKEVENINKTDIQTGENYEQTIDDNLAISDKDVLDVNNILKGDCVIADNCNLEEITENVEGTDKLNVNTNNSSVKPIENTTDELNDIMDIDFGEDI